MRHDGSMRSAREAACARCVRRPLSHGDSTRYLRPERPRRIQSSGMNRLSHRMPTESATRHSAVSPQKSAPVVIIVDDEERMRSALRRLFFTEGIAVEVYESGTELLEKARFDRSGCLILDVKMPGMSGLEVQAVLNQRGVDMPTIFLTGASDVPIAVTAMRAGAADFLEKPFENEQLVARVRQAIERHQKQRIDTEERRELATRFASLTPRELEVLELVVTGQTSKEIARTLGASHRTIEIHRNHLMEKTGAESLADLIRMRLLERGA
jgi:two-component system response regulator FixJ